MADSPAWSVVWDGVLGQQLIANLAAQARLSVNDAANLAADEAAAKVR